jgi:hypothetical protein
VGRYSNLLAPTASSSIQPHGSHAEEKKRQRLGGDNAHQQLRGSLHCRSVNMNRAPGRGRRHHHPEDSSLLQHQQQLQQQRRQQGGGGGISSGFGISDDDLAGVDVRGEGGGFSSILQGDDVTSCWTAADQSVVGAAEAAAQEVSEDGKAHPNIKVAS